MPVTRDIMIIDGDTSTEQLRLDPSTTLGVNKGDRVNWFITEGKTNVASFRIEKKRHSPNIFNLLEQPPSRHTRSGRGRVGPFSGGKLYEYNIYWKTSVNSPAEYKHDPKIYVNPTLHSEEFLKVAVTMAFGLGFLALTLLFLEKRKRMQKEKFNERKR